MTDFGRRAGEMLKSVYDTNEDGVVDDSAKLDASTKAQVQDHTPQAHGHAMSVITGLISALAGKSATGHTHTESEITDLDHDATKIQGIEVDDTDIADTKVLAYNSTSGKLEYETPSAGTTPTAILGDATPGRVFRASALIIDNGSTGDSLKCTLVSKWNGDVIAETDNISKDATTGDFSLTVDGHYLYVEPTGLSGNVLFCISAMACNAAMENIDINISAYSNAIRVKLTVPGDCGDTDLTALVDLGLLLMIILYITDA